MKSLCTVGLVLLVGLGWSARAADAQSGAPATRRPLQPLPPVTQVSSNLVPVGYTRYYSPDAAGKSDEPSHPQAAQQQQSQAGPGGFNSAFTTQTQAIDDTSNGGNTAAQAPGSTAPWCGCEDALHDTCWDDCDSCGCDYGYSGCGHFFGAVGGLVMTRTRANAFTTTYEAGGSFEPVMNTQSAGAGWTGGGEVTLGYAFGGANNAGPWGASGMCGGPGIAVTWWGLGEMTGFASVTDPVNGLDASFDLSGVTINGNPWSTYFAGADSQRIWRTDNANNVEANLLSGSIFDTDKMQLIGLAGFRYFRFSEVLTFGSLQGGGDWNVPDDSGYISFRTINNLYGAQMGAVFTYMVTPRLTGYITPKAGLFGNQMTANTRIYSGNGSTSYNYTAYKTDFAFLGQVDAGYTYAFRPNSYLYLGYRVVGMSNLALGDNQFMPTIGTIKQSGSLILHGATFGLAWLY